MTKIVYAAFAALAVASCATKAPEVAQAPAESLRNRLQMCVDSGKVVFGQHDATSYGIGWRGESARSDVKSVVGDYPGLINWDLGLIEWDAPSQLDGVPFDDIRAGVAAQDARGGINAISWHPRNAATGGDSWDVSASPVAEMGTPGTALADTLDLWLGRAADFILSLKDADGRRVPVLFRPWHEHTGSWFWWGRDLCTPEQYKELWRRTRAVFDAKGVDNVLWVYSPDRVADFDDYSERYPGDEYVDVLGADAYHHGGEAGTEEFMARARVQLDAAVRMAAPSGKLVALSETGCEGLAVTDWYDSVLTPLIEGYPLAYVCVWRNADNIPGHFYAPYPGHPSCQSFMKFYNNPKILFAAGMAQMK